MFRVILNLADKGSFATRMVHQNSAPTEEDKNNEVGRVQKEHSFLDILWFSTEWKAKQLQNVDNTSPFQIMQIF